MATMPSQLGFRDEEGLTDQQNRLEGALTRKVAGSMRFLKEFPIDGGLGLRGGGRRFALDFVRSGRKKSILVGTTKGPRILPVFTKRHGFSTGS